MKRNLKRIFAIALAAAMTASLAACGGGDSEQEQAKLPEFVYVPEYMELEEGNSYWSMKLAGDALYYEQYSYDEATQTSQENIVRYSLADGTTKTVPVSLGEEQSNMNLNSFQVGPDESLYLLLTHWDFDEATGESKSQYFLVKQDIDGNEIFRQEITEIMQREDAQYVNYFVIDGEGRSYVSTGEEKILLFDGEGNFQGSVEVGGGMNSWINGMGTGGDGKVYACCYSNNGNSGGYALQEIDFEKRAVANTYENYPSSNGNGELAPGGERSFLVNGGSTAYEYNLDTQTAEPLFNWIDSDINGQYVNGMGMAPDGRILATINDWGTGEYSIALLTKTPSSEVPQKELLTIGTLNSSSELMSAAVNFNKTNDKYRVTIKNYIDDTMNLTETTYSDGINNFNNDIVSGNCPDILDLSSMNAEQLAASGALEDMMPFLENSAVLNRADYLENVLDGYTYDGVLVGIPKTFYIQTIAGSAKDLGNEPGWSLEEMIQYANGRPEASLFDYGSKDSIMSTLLMYNESQFVDWTEGKCNFNSPEFISLLEFVNRFPEDADYSSEVSTPNRIANGEVLLDQVHISDFNDIQMYYEIFRDGVNFIGFPNAEGSAGCAMTTSNIYAIASKSRLKEGAWAFIESYLSSDSDRFSWGFPSNKAKLDEALEEAVKVETYTWVDEDGVEHEEVASGGGSVMYSDGWSYEYHTPTREEAEQVMALIKEAKPRATQNSQILSIISEEAAAFYAGQKSAADAADVIQRRAQTYVDENS
ncbi:MAG: extracellular solute-binding protein [Roseburia sp.]|nr:extracellular solute-binding protein [Roseburia sp.]MCM1096452.1 extracellular solute-binding protein [Ruminococcus flavefaciens]